MSQIHFLPMCHQVLIILFQLNSCLFFWKSKCLIMYLLWCIQHTVWHYYMEVFNDWMLCNTYLYSWTMEQMVWEKDLSCMAVQRQTLSQHFLAQLYMHFMLYLWTALQKYRVLLWYRLRLGHLHPLRPTPYNPLCFILYYIYIHILFI